MASQATSNQRNTNDSNKDGATYACLLKNELLGAGIEDVKEQQNDATNAQRSALLPKETRNLFQVTPEFITKIFGDMIFNDDEEKIILPLL